ncbi:deubiquitination module subunit SGF73 [Pneumocystis jirovecii RU7]|uniref:SCA7 domain-containing protein n=1 Tax=Pneumocystis jirovecii (strain RU7) TaxID=1408657 RepID=A0A0W4ZHS8_PNEJ7|nr:deubiquitination module subunit SGF73 [Pneumocystis jirovecii RU7]KTW27925.1 hypothetical protein T551_02892 [Pneumocystis jirovecii RU7]
MSDKENNALWSPVVSALFSEKSLSLFDEKAKKLSVKLYNKDKDWKENGQYFFEIAEELDKEEPMALWRELNPDTPGSPITTILDIDEFEKYGYNPLSETMKYIHCKKCGRVVLQTVFYKHEKICNQLQDNDVTVLKKGYGKNERDLQNTSIKRFKKRLHFDADSDSSILDGLQRASKISKYDYKNKSELKKLKSKNILTKQKNSIDLEKQCGVLLPNGNLCSRSLTCKSHSMGAKRAVPGRSQPYDILLAHYQKKNQIKQQKAATISSVFDEYASDTKQVDSEEEVALVMESILSSSACPLERKIMVPVRIKRRFFRFQEMFSTVFSQDQWPGKIKDQWSEKTHDSTDDCSENVIPFHVNSDWIPDENSQSSVS